MFEVACRLLIFLVGLVLAQILVYLSSALGFYGRRLLQRPTSAEKTQMFLTLDVTMTTTMAVVNSFAVNHAETKSPVESQLVRPPLCTHTGNIDRKYIEEMHFGGFEDSGLNRKADKVQT